MSAPAMEAAARWPWARTRRSAAAGKASRRRSAARWPGSARARPDIVGLTADLGKYTDILPFRDAFPDRFFNVGMAEQNLVAVAAGLARTGMVPFATTYGVFASRRAYDFVAIALAHSNLNVKIVAGLPGLTTGYGGTHQAIEDLALMRMIPGLTVIDPCDATEIEAATLAIADHPGPVYMRLLRGSVPVVLDPGYQFEIGKAHKLRDGKDVGIISTGFMTERALDAADVLAEDGHFGRRAACALTSSRSMPRPSRLSPLASTTSSRPKTMSSSAAWPASSSRPCSTPASPQGDAHRPAGPLHRMRCGADIAGAAMA